MKIDGKLDAAERVAAREAVRRNMSHAIWQLGNEFWVFPANVRRVPKGATCVDEIGPAQAKQMLAALP